LADRFEAELHLLSVLDDTTPMFFDPEIMPMDSLVQQQRVAISKKLDQQPGSPWDENLTVVREIRQGSPFLEIIRYAKENNIDLIVLGTHGRSGLAHVLLGSVAERVVRIAPCPVLTVRHPEHEFVMP
jgi:nucleotide-binding universal stress UspA family protein